MKEVPFIISQLVAIPDEFEASPSWIASVQKVMEIDCGLLQALGFTHHGRCSTTILNDGVLRLKFIELG